MALLRILVIGLLILLSRGVPAAAQTPSPDDPPAPFPDQPTPEGTTVILLAGADTSVQTNIGRSDVLMLAAVNTPSQTISFLSLPRDLYVLLPDGSVGRINTAWSLGEAQEPGHGSIALMETIHTNLGIQVDYWARVDFADFRQMIDDLGGVELVVDCALRDWRLITPDLDPALEESWEQYTLPLGVHTMDGDLALWYVRSRRTSSDFDRGRRQQAVLQALWRRIRSLGLDAQLTSVWPQMLDLVDTNLPLETALELLPTGLALSPSRMTHLTMRMGREVSSWRSPEGSSVLAPNRDALMETVQQFLTPPTANQLANRAVTVEIVNASGFGDMDDIAAWRLGWEGVEATIAEPAARAQDTTQLIDLAGQSKASPGELLARVLGLDVSALEMMPDTARTADFRLILGRNFYPCTYQSATALPTSAP